MRKYQQLALLIVSILSVFLMVIYRNEYIRLYNVLSYFDFFGHLCNLSEVSLEPRKLFHDWGPVPTWQQIEESETFVYSAFWKRNEVKAVTVSRNVNHRYMCYLWFESKANPVIGKFKYMKMSSVTDNSERFLYSFTCISSDKEEPYAVSFASKSKSKTELSLIPIFDRNEKHAGNAVVCVEPSQFSKKSVVEFIAYHQIVGINNFVIYTNNLPYRLFSTIDVISKSLNINVAYFPWNYPGSSGSLMKEIIKEDCLLRSEGDAQNILILSWNDYVVPKYHDTVVSMLSSLDSNNHTQKFNAPVLIFCIKSEDSSKATAMQNLVYDVEKSIDLVKYIYRSNIFGADVISSQVIPEGTAAIHRYVKCTKFSAHSKKDGSILRFSIDMSKTSLMKLLKYNKI